MIELDCYNKDIFIYFFVNIHVNFHSACFQCEKKCDVVFQPEVYRNRCSKDKAKVY